MEEMLKLLRFITLCALVLSGYVFADSGNSTLYSDVSKRVVAQAADVSGVDDLLSDLKSGVNGVNKSKSGVQKFKPDAAFFSYLNVIRNEIKNQLGDSLEIYKGMTCSMKVGLSRDGTVLYAVENGGDADLCNNAIDAVHRIKKFPSPPSDRVYQTVRDFTIDFKF